MKRSLPQMASVIKVLIKDDQAHGNEHDGVDENKELKFEDQSEDNNLPTNNDAVLAKAYVKPVKTIEPTQEKYKSPKNVHSTRLPTYNKRALPAHASTYRLEKFEKKVLVIFNQENVFGRDSREGTKEDVKSLIKTFENVGFTVYKHKDFTTDQISNALKKFFAQDFTEIGCVAIAVLAHGGENGLLIAKDGTFNDADIIKHLTSSANPTLVTKPKFFIVQACRGETDNVAQPVRVAYRDHLKNKEYTIPKEADLLILHSTYSGNTAFRDPVDGSWLIHSLCKHINALAPTTDLESIIVQVKKEVAIERSHVEKKYNTTEINKQIPVMISTLIRQLYLRKFEYSSGLTSTDSQDDVMTEPEILNVTSAMSLPGSTMSKQMDLFTKQYFVYLVKCLEFYVAENPEDTVAQSYLGVTQTFGNSKMFDSTKEEMINILCKYFDWNIEKMQFNKYLFIKKNKFDDEDYELIMNELRKT